MKRLLIALIDAYRLLLSPFFGTQCRFHPTCSGYAREAIAVHGALRGCWLAARRLLKCHPWHPGGIDPVPPRGGRRGERGAG
jgi:putative membrane protein insertion efficiency factor